MGRRWLMVVAAIVRVAGLLAAAGGRAVAAADGATDQELAAVLNAAGFTGRIEFTLTQRLGRPINTQLADLGRLLWFDNVHSLHQDNTCAGCHSPTNAFGDTQSIAIGIQSNRIVGPDRTGPRNQRRTPSVINTAFYPRLMWNGRFNAPGGDPFDNSEGFLFPAPEGEIQFPPRHPVIRHLLQAQAHIPPTETVEVAGFTGVCRSVDLGPDSPFCQFDDGKGLMLPLPGDSGFRNDPIRRRGEEVLNGISAYRELFGRLFPEVDEGSPITFEMFALAIAEFEFSLTFANAPIDRFARGDRAAMTDGEKRGALLFFGKAGCVTCHAVAGDANEMFSDFKDRVVGVPQIAPGFGKGVGNMFFDGPGQNEDFGLTQITGDQADLYKFRTAPLRNIALAPAFFHNGAFTRLEDAIDHHLDVFSSVRRYDARSAGVDEDLCRIHGPIEPVLERLDPWLVRPVQLGRLEFEDLVEFVRTGLLDERAKKENLCRMVPRAVPSRTSVLRFQGCERR